MSLSLSHQIIIILWSSAHRSGSRVNNLIEQRKVERSTRVYASPETLELKAATLVRALPQHQGRAGDGQTVVQDDEQDQPHVLGVQEGEGMDFFN